MRLPGPSYAVESVLGAAVVLLCVVVLYPDPPPRKPNATAVHAEPPPRPIPNPTPNPAGRDDAGAFADAEIHRGALEREWTRLLADSGESLTVDRTRRAAVWNAHLTALRAETVGAFEATAGKDAPWADDARAALDAQARLIVTRQLTHQTPEPLLRAEEAARARAVAAGCDDPHVGFWNSRAATRDGAADPDGFRAAVDRLADSAYPPARRLGAVLEWLQTAQRLRPNHPLRADVAACEARFWELFAAAARLRTLVADEDLLDVATHWQTYRLRGGADREEVLAELDRHVRRAGGRDYLRRTVRGEGLMYAVWDTPDAPRDEVNGRLTEAHQLLLDAMEADPDGYSAPARLLSVCTALGVPRDEMEDVFRRAMHANPDNHPACFARLDYLHPRRCGSADGTDYLRGCWAIALYPGDGWVQDAVLRNLFTNHPVAGPVYATDPRVAGQFYQRDDVFGAVWTACRIINAARPADRATAFVMARVGCVTGRYDVARVYFNWAGPVVAPGLFADQAEYDHFRRQAGVTP